MKLSEGQQQALEKIKELSGEHFDTSIFIYEVRNPENDNHFASGYTTGSGTTFVGSLGLLEVAKIAMIHPDRDEE